MTSWADSAGSTLAARADPSYVLIADTDPERAAMCVLESMNALRGGVVVVRDGDHAVAQIARSGPPALLVIDLALPGKDAFAVIDALRSLDHGRAAVFGWASSREQREFARYRLAAADVTVLRGSAPADILRSALGSITREKSPRRRVDVSDKDATEFDERLRSLAAAARRIGRTPGVAVYLKDETARDEGGFRAFVDWSADEPMPASPEMLPRVAHTIVDTGEGIAWPDLTPDVGAGGAARGVRGLVGVPVVTDTGVREGAIIVFDTGPIALRHDDMDALTALGRGAPIPLAGAGRPIEPPREPRALVQRAPNQLEPPLPFRRRAVAPQIPDRAAAGFAIGRELARVRRDQTRLSVILFDVTAREGPPDAEAPLPFDPVQAAHDTLSRTSLGSDLTIRWEDDQLLLVLPGLEEAEARRVAERLRASMQAAAAHRVAVSGGVAELASADNFESVVAKARDRLTLARTRGNRIG